MMEFEMSTKMAVGEISFVLNNSNEGWIIEKLCSRLAKQLESHKFKPKIVSKCEHRSRYTVFMHYQNVEVCSEHCLTKKFAFVYHVDDLQKLLIIRKLLKRGITLFFISRSQLQFVYKVLRLRSYRSQLRYIGIGTDLAQESESMYQRPLTIGIASHRYPDGRKNEKWIRDALNSQDPHKIRIIFYGKRWEGEAEFLRSRNFNVEILRINSKDFKDEYLELLRRMREWDIAIYAGFDEGSLGILDAYFLGCDLLVSRQGFHKDLNLGEDNYFMGKFAMRKKLSDLVQTRYFDRNLKSDFFSWETMALRIVRNLECLDDNEDFEGDVMIKRDWKETNVLMRIVIRNSWRRLLKKATSEIQEHI